MYAFPFVLPLTLLLRCCNSLIHHGDFYLPFWCHTSRTLGWCSRSPSPLPPTRCHTTFPRLLHLPFLLLVDFIRPTPYACSPFTRYTPIPTRSTLTFCPFPTLRYTFHVGHVLIYVTFLHVYVYVCYLVTAFCCYTVCSRYLGYVLISFGVTWLLISTFDCAISTTPR